MAMNDLFSNLPTMMQAFGGMSLMSEGADQAIQGAAYNAGLYRMAANNSVDVAEYNVALQELNSARQKDAMATEYENIRKKNMSNWSTSGFSFSSGSYNAVQNKVQSTMEHQLIQQKNNDIIAKQNIRYEGQVAAVNYENQARSATYQGQIASYNAEQQQAQSMGKLFTSALSLAGS